MTKYLTEKQRKFCEYYYESLKIGAPNSFEAAVKAGFTKDSAKCYHAALLKNKKIEDYLIRLKKLEEEYSKEQYLKDLATAEKLALKGNNLALYLKIIQAKAKIYGLDKAVEMDDEENRQGEIKSPKTKKGRAYSMRYSNKNNDNERIDLFNKIEERSHVFEKIRHTNA